MAQRSAFKIFFGWWTTLAAAAISLWTSGYYVLGISALFKPIASDLGLSRAATSVATSIGRLEGGFEGPLAGWACDRFGPRRVVLFGVFFAVLGLVLMNYINSLGALILIWGVVVGTGNNLAQGVPVDTAISNWFVRKRGVAIGIKWTFTGLGAVILVPFIAWLIVFQGWRMACVIGGLMLALIGLPLAWFFIKDHRPEYYGLMPDGASTGDASANREQMIERGVKYAAEQQEVEFTLRQAMKTPVYWLLIAVQAMFGLVGPVMNVHLIPFLTDIGIDPVEAAGMMSVMIGASIPIRLVVGFIADRIRIDQLRFLNGGAYLLMTVSVTIFLLYQNTAAIYTWLSLYGMGMGIIQIVQPLITARYFGRKAYGSMRGVLTLSTSPVSVAAPIYVGWIYDTTGSYMSAFTLFAVLLTIGGIIACLILPPKPPAIVTDVHRII